MCTLICGMYIIHLFMSRKSNMPDKQLNSNTNLQKVPLCQSSSLSSTIDKVQLEAGSSNIKGPNNIKIFRPNSHNEMTYLYCYKTGWADLQRNNLSRWKCMRVNCLSRLIGVLKRRNLLFSHEMTKRKEASLIFLVDIITEFGIRLSLTSSASWWTPLSNATVSR